MLKVFIYFSILLVELVDLGVAQFGSAREWGSRGRRFESSHSDHFALWQIFFTLFCLKEGKIINMENLHKYMDQFDSGLVIYFNFNYNK